MKFALAPLAFAAAHLLTPFPDSGVAAHHVPTLPTGPKGPKHKKISLCGALNQAGHRQQELYGLANPANPSGDPGTSALLS